MSKKNFIQFDCLVCGEKFTSGKGAYCHLKKHNLNTRSYYDKYLKSEGEGECLHCEEPTTFGGLVAGYMKCCSRSCGRSHALETNPESDLPRIEKMRELWSDPEWRAKRLREIKERDERAFMQTDEYKARVSKASLEKHQDPVIHDRMMFGLRNLTTEQEAERILKMSKTKRELFKDPEYMKKAMSGCKGYGHHGRYFSKKNNKEVHYRSSWELRAYEMLETEDDTVVSYQVEPLGIPYIGPDGGSHTYYPDLYVQYSDGTSYFIEIKPSMFLNDPWVVAKLAALRGYARVNYVHGVKIWTEHELWVA